MHFLRSFIPVLLFAVDLVPARESNDVVRRETTLAAPIVGTPSEVWEGIDGTWSTFEIRVGTPNQVFRVLPATSWQETWVIWNVPNTPMDVCNTTLGVSSDCGDSRGGVFDDTNSTSWESNAEYALDLNEKLGYSGAGNYGFDFVGLGYTNTSGITLGHQIVAEIVSDTFWFGLLGMGFQPTNFSGYGDPQASFSDTLSTNGSISSRSWSYTAGAYYRLKSVFGQMIFGGYDSSRFTPNDVVFTMTGDNERDIVVTVRSIVSTTSSGNTTLMSEAEFAFIDSTVPEFWLPVEVCQAFEDALGIELDDATGLYLVNSSTHDSLLSLNPNITLTLANEKSGGSTVDLVLPYAAFDLSVSAPKYNGSSYYFPLRQAQNDTQYTLGRAFLQEVYVTTDYNTRTFNVSQCIFDDSSSADIVAIPSDLPASTSTAGSDSGSGSGGGDSDSGSGSDSGLSGGAIAGIVVAIVAAIVVAGLILVCWKRGLLCFRTREKPPPDPVYEIDAGKRIEPEKEGHTGQASALTSELPGADAKVEIAGNPIMAPQELPAEVPEGYTTTTSRDVTPLTSHPDRERYAGHSGFGAPPRIRELRGDDDFVSPVSPRAPGHGFGTGAYSPVSEPTVSDPTEGSSSRGSHEY